jgi:hypothetical protein
MRGQGKLLYLGQATPFELLVDNSLIALSGPLAHLGVSLPESPGKTARLAFHRTTTYLGEPLVHLADRKTGKGQLWADVEATDSLFAAPDDNGRPLLLLEGLSNSMERRALEWTGRRNAFCGYETVLEQQANDGRTMTLKDGSWQNFTGDTMDGDRATSSLLVRQGLDLNPLSETPYAEVTPSQVRAALTALQEAHDKQTGAPAGAPLSGYGADLADLQRLTFPAPSAQPTALPIEEMMLEP